MKATTDEVSKKEVIGTSQTRPLDTLMARLKSGEAKIGVVGLGYVGLPLAVEMANSGYSVTGIDINPMHVSKINSKTSPIADISDETLAQVLDKQEFAAISEISAIADHDASIVCVPTPLTKTKTPDFVGLT